MVMPITPPCRDTGAQLWGFRAGSCLAAVPQPLEEGTCLGLTTDAEKLLPWQACHPVWPCLPPTTLQLSAFLEYTEFSHFGAFAQQFPSFPQDWLFLMLLSEPGDHVELPLWNSHGPWDLSCFYLLF